MIPKNPYFQNRKPVVLDTGKESLTKQSEKEQCNIHNILNQFAKTGIVEHVNTKTPQSVDHTQIPTFQETLNLVTQVNQQFELLPEDLKKKFPTKESLAEYISDPENYAEAVELGILPSTESTETDGNTSNINKIKDTNPNPEKKDETKQTD